MMPELIVSGEGPRPFKCPHCSEAFVWGSDLKEHMTSEHPPGSRTSPEDPDPEFSSPTIKQASKTSHHKSFPEFRCPHCTRSFRQKSHLAVHINGVHLDKGFKCHIEGCGYISLTSNYLKMHLKSHSDERSFICEICSNAYKYKKDLKKHLEQTHNSLGPRPRIPCSQCPKTFLTKSHLTVHVKGVHLDKGVKCPFEGCGHSALTQNHLQMHMAIHSDSRNFKCDKCSKAFKRAKDLNKHGKKHERDEARSSQHTDKEFKCEKCWRAYKHKKDLGRHIKKVHGEKSESDEEIESPTVDEVVLVKEEILD